MLGIILIQFYKVLTKKKIIQLQKLPDSHHDDIFMSKNYDCFNRTDVIDLLFFNAKHGR